MLSKFRPKTPQTAPVGQSAEFIWFFEFIFGGTNYGTPSYGLAEFCFRQTQRQSGYFSRVFGRDA